MLRLSLRNNLVGVQDLVQTITYHCRGTYEIYGITKKNKCLHINHMLNMNSCLILSFSI